MNRIFYRLSAAKMILLMMGIACACLGGGCAGKQQVPVVDKPVYFNELQPAAKHLSASLARQLDATTEGTKPPIVVDMFFNEQSSEVSISGRSLQGMIADALSKGTPPLSASILGVKTLQKAQLAISGTFKLQASAGKESKSWMVVKAKAQNILSGKIVAQAEVYVDSRQFNAEPIKFYKDAPMYMTAARAKQAAAIPEENLAQTLTINAKLADAREAYEAENFATAELIFSDVLSQEQGKNFVALSGMYQSLIRLNRLAEAEKAFGKLVDLGLESGSLSLKFLFKVGSTDFLSKGDLTTQYPLWISQIAQQLSTKTLCLNVNGHASRTGSADLNERLSLHRAERIVSQLKKAKPVLSSRLKAYGKGFRENLVGSGTNDALDAIDRRVDFDVTRCN